MSADLLHRAAALMRERAEQATPGPWAALCDGYGDTSGGPDHDDRRDLLWIRSGPTNAGDIVTTYGEWTERSEHDVLHIASWHPSVALVVADWLDFTATAREAIDMVAAHDPERAMGSEASKCFTDLEAHALTIARAYLGEPS